MLKLLGFIRESKRLVHFDLSKIRHGRVVHENDLLEIGKDIDIFEFIGVDQTGKSVFADSIIRINNSRHVLSYSMIECRYIPIEIGSGKRLDNFDLSKAIVCGHSTVGSF